MFHEVVRCPKRCCQLYMRRRIFKRLFGRCFRWICCRYHGLVKTLLCIISGFILIFLVMGWIRQPYKPGSIPIDVQSTPSLTKTDTPGAALEDLQIVTYQDSIIRGKTVLPALALPNYRSKILSRNMTSWYFNDEVCRGISNETGKFVLAHLRAPQYIPIYVYEENEDVWVSGNVIKRGMWEIELVVKIQGILAEDLDTTFIDIGANVGVYALTAAKLGCKVVAIDAFEGNIARLCKSTEAGNLTRNIVLIYNAVSNTREKVALEVGKGNIGGTYVRKLNQTFQDRYVVNSILLDDLLEVVIPRKVVIKMDVETFEAKVLEGGRKFFNIADVICVLIEFGSHRKSKSGEFIVRFLKEFKLEPDVPPNIKGKYRKWPGEVLFTRVRSEGNSVTHAFECRNVAVIQLIFLSYLNLI